MACILIIDDEELVRFSLRRILEDAGHRVVEACDGDEGLARLAEGGIDIVISDILMPGKEGIETIVEVRRENPRLGILAISGGGRFGNYDFLQLALQFGANAILAKPFSREKLLELVDSILLETAE